MSLKRISESDDHVVDYDPERGMYRVSIFKDYHYQDEFWFDAYEEKELPEFVKEFDRPIKNLYDVAALLCLATSLSEDDCRNCPVVIHSYEKRTEYEKCCLHEPCQTNLYKWLIEQANKEISK